MRLLASAFSMLASLASPASPASVDVLDALDRDRFLNAIAHVEGHKGTDLGGRYGIKIITWRQYTRMPYAASRNLHQCRHVAGMHLTWLIKNLQAKGYAPTVYRLAACWRWGLEGAIARFSDKTGAKIDYADRVHNLYYSTHILPDL